MGHKFILQCKLSFYGFILFKTYIFCNPYHNEWIDLNKTYYKIKITENGIYKVSAEEINKIPNITTSNVAIVRRGKTIPLLVEDKNQNGFFDTGDFILFAGKRNDGFQDSELYNFPDRYPNPYRALHSDTAIYYVTTTINPPRISKEKVFENAPTIPFVVFDSIQSFFERYEHGERIIIYNDPIALSDYSNLEGFISSNENINHTFVFPPHFINTNLFSPKFECTIVPTKIQPGRSGSLIQKLITPNNPITVGQYSFTSKNNRAFKNFFSVPSSSIINNQVTITCDAVNSNHNTFSFSYIKWMYPIKDSVEKNYHEWIIPEAISGKWNLTKIPLGYQIWVESGDEIYTAPQNNRVFFVETQGTAIVYVFNESSIREVKLHKVNFRKYEINSDSLFLILSHRAINKPYQGVEYPVFEYAKYKHSPAGGGFDTLVVFVEDLYDQFSYGEKTPLAIRRFLKYLCRGNYTPAYLFIIGKAFELTANTRQRNTQNEIDLVPTWGNPGSDYLFSAGIKGTNPAVQTIPTGRLVAYGPQEVVSYLNKIKEYELSVGREIWRKNVLHLTGGRSSGEIATFRNFGLSMADIINGSYFGANTQVFSKTTGEAVQIFNVSEEVNNGVSLILFHGHSSPGVSDINIGYVTNPSLNYNNKGKYPIIILNGCESGNIFIERDAVFGVTFGENWIVTPNKGAINFLGHSNFGFDFTLRNYTTLIYNEWFRDSSQIHWSIGKILQKVNKLFLQDFTNTSDLNIAQATQFVLQGDPSVKLFPKPLPEYSIDANRVNITTHDNSILTSLADSFYVNFQVNNTGIYPPNQQVEILIKRILPNGEVKNYPKFFTNDIKIKKNVFISIPLADLDFKSVGENTLEIVIDPDNKIQEFDETNNKVIIKFFIFASGLSCVLPPEFSIQGSKQLTLVAQSSDLLKQETSYLFEIDTTIKFNSPLKKEKIVLGKATFEWSLNLDEIYPGLKDSTVFYWRVSFSNSPSNSNLFSQSSFLFIENSPGGWAQHHFEQFFKNSFNNLYIDDSLKIKKINAKKLEIDIKIGKNQETTGHTYKLSINKQVLIQSPCGYFDQGYYPGDDGLYIIGIRRNDFSLITIPQIEKLGMYQASSGSGFIYCTEKASAVYRLFPYSHNYWFNEGYTYYPNNDDMINFLNVFFENVNEGDYVAFFTTGQPKVNQWDSRIVNILINYLKTDLFTKIGQKAQMIYFGQKNIGPIQEVITDTLNNDENYKTLHLYSVVEIGIPTAKMISTIIGPTNNWNKFYRKVKPYDTIGEDWNISFTGIDLNNVSTLILENTKLNSIDLNNISISHYPYIRLTYHVKDEINFIPSQLNSWIITYDATTPEGTLVLNDNSNTYTKIPELQEGSTYSIPFIFKNVSQYPFFSPLIVEYTIRNTEIGFTKVIRDTLYEQLNPNSQLIITPQISTLGLVGENVFQIYVNPKIQPEINYLNNIWTTRFRVFKDRINPIIGLHIDRRKIKNGDIVSSSPQIELYIKDENPYKRKLDTSNVKFLIRKNCPGCDFERINFRNNSYKIDFASNNNITILYINPKNLSDGTYTLCVEATDASDNQAGTRPYCIDFNVVNQLGISYFLPIPNPFFEELRFAYQLTGKLVPDELTIYIFNINGQLVRKLGIDELGKPQAGNNITLPWNGKDQKGNLLPPGLYFYKTEAKINGQKLPHIPTELDNTIHNGYGKFILMR